MSNDNIQELINTIILLQKPWLNPNELEQDFNISKSTQAKMRMNRKIPFHKVGKYIRYSRDEINKMFSDAKVV